MLNLLKLHFSLLRFSVAKNSNLCMQITHQCSLYVDHNLVLILDMKKNCRFLKLLLKIWPVCLPKPKHNWLFLSYFPFHCIKKLESKWYDYGIWDISYFILISYAFEIWWHSLMHVAGLQYRTLDCGWLYCILGECRR